MQFSNAIGAKVPNLFVNGGVFVQTSFIGIPMPPPTDFYLLDNSSDHLLDNSGDPFLTNEYP